MGFVCLSRSRDEEALMNKHQQDNRADQLNPTHDSYWQSRGEKERPEDWKERLEEKHSPEPAKSN
jgi:hypothetical protein